MTAPATLVVGLGATGRSIIGHLAGRERVLAIDTRAAPPLADELRRTFPGVEFFAPDAWRRALASASRVAFSPGLALDHSWAADARATGTPLVSDIELFLAAAAPTPVVGVTGTNGKSTVVALLGELFAAAGLDAGVGGNLGPPALALLGPSRDIYALELSSFQLERLARPALHVAAVLNVTADHGDRHPDLDAYAAVKRRVYRGAAHAVCNADDPRTAPAAGADAPTRVIALNGDPKWRIDGPDLVLNGSHVATAELALTGRHNHFNALAAAAVAWRAGLAVDRQRAALVRFEGLPHRVERVATVDGVAYVDDSKATNVGACRAALESFGDGRGNIVLIAGGDAKGAGFGELAATLRRHVGLLVLIGRDADRLAAAAGNDLATVRAADMAEAVRVARRAARPGDTVLLSPACASFDMYGDFAARGDAFRTAARGLANGGHGA